MNAAGAPYAVTLASAVTVNGLTLGNDGTLNLTGGSLVVTGTVLNPNPYFVFAGPHTLTGNGHVIFDGPYQCNVGSTVNPFDTLTVSPGITVRTGTGSASLASVTNQGVVSAETPGQYITFSQAWSNADGTIQASNGSRVFLAGPMAPAMLGTLSATSGGQIVIAGPLGLGGTTLARTGPSGDLRLGNNAYVSNGTLSATAGASFTASAAGQNVQFATVTLEAVTLSGNMTVDSRTSVRFVGDLALAAAHVSLADLGESANNGTSLLTATSQGIGGDGVISFDGTTGQNRLASYGGTLTIGPGVAVRTGVGSGTVGPVSSTGVLTFINYGTISAQTPGQSITLTGKNWSNLGTIEAKNGATLNLAGAFTLDSIGTLLVSDGGAVNVAGALTLSGSTLTLSSSLPLGLTAGGAISGGTVASADSTTLLARGGNCSLTSVSLNTPFSLLAPATVTFSSSIANQPITASGVGSSVILSGSWSNNSSVSASNGATLSLGGSPGSIGSISVADSTLNLTGAYTAAQIRALSLSNPTVRIATGGNLNVTGDTFHIDTFTGNVQLAGGRITGGTLSAADGFRLVANTATSSFLDGVTLSTEFVLGFGANVTVLNGMTLSSGHVGLTNDAVLTVSGSAPVTGTGEISFDGSPPLAPSGPVVLLSTLPAFRPSSSGTLTIGPGVTVRTNTSGGTVGLNTRPLINNGTISAESAGKSITLFGSTITNAGTLQANSASTLIISTPSFTNSGAITVGASSMLLLANGATTNGTFNLSGNAVLDYTGTSPVDAVRQQLAIGRDGVTGIVRPEAAGDPTRAVAYVEASLLLGLTGSQTATWSGQVVDATSLLLFPARFGDANFDGKVDGDDYALLDRGLAKGLAGWVNGDFNYDGAVTTADYLLIDATLAAQAPLSPEFLAQRESRFGADYVAQLLATVPEPSSPACVVGVATALASRGRRRGRGGPAAVSE